MLGTDNEASIQFDQRFNVEVYSGYHAVHVYNHGIELTASQLKNLQFHRSLRDCHTHVLRLCFAGVQRRHRALAEQGRLKVIGQLGAQRSELLKNVPAVSKELKNFSYKIWSVLMVPSNTPGNVVQRLHKAIGATLQDPSVRSQLAAQTQLTSAPMSVAESINLLLQ